MATKPTERILDWASGGVVTDPGAGKEATGWVVDDRPPANWWNWILNSFGKWLTYFEAQTDEHITQISSLNILAPRVIGRVRSGASPTVQRNITGISSVNTVGSTLRVTFSSPFLSTSEYVAVASPDAWFLTVGCNPITASIVSLEATNATTGSVQDLSTAVHDFNIVVFGDLAP